MIIRAIKAEDNAAVAHIIHTVMPEFNCVGEGFSINDPEVDDMAGAYVGDGAGYFVLEQSVGGPAGAKKGFNGAVIVGGGGFAPLAGGDPDTCELRKMYLLKEGRGFGGGKLLLEACLAGAKAAGYTKMYLETVCAMEDAATLYQKYGFKYLSWPLGETGHGGCDRYMLREL